MFKRGKMNMRLFLMLTLVVGIGFSRSTLSQVSPVLSATGLYSDINQFVIATDVREYKVQYPLFNDGVLKRRWIYLPSGSKVNTSNPNWWNFPEGTKIWKEFSFNFNGKFKRIETRLIQKVGGNWKFSTYLWDHLDTEAVLSDGKMLLKYADLGEGVFHNVPGERNCKSCHFAKDGADPVLGFSAIQLDHNEEGLNISKLKNENLLTHKIADDISIKATTPEGVRALGLLHANCSHCHNPNGSMSFLSMNLRHDVSNKNAIEENTYQSTVNQKSGFEFPDTPGPQKRILPGQPEVSVLYRRIKVANHLDPDFGLKMPPGPIGTMTQNKELLKYLESFIKSIPAN